MTQIDEAAQPPLTEPPLQSAQPGYQTLLRIRWGVWMVVLVLPFIVADALIIRPIGGAWGVLSLVAIAIGLVWRTPQRQFAHLGFAMSDDRLRVAHGYMFHTDTIVPFVRIQHIDVGQGPLERLCGVAHIVVHTAGTHNSIVTVPGLDRDAAHAMREAIRRHIVTDFA